MFLGCLFFFINYLFNHHSLTAGISESRKSSESFRELSTSSSASLFMTSEKSQVIDVHMVSYA